MLSEERRIATSYAGIWDNLIRPVPAKPLHWADYKQPFTYAWYRELRKRGYATPYSLQWVERQSRVSTTPIQQAVLDAESEDYDKLVVTLNDDVTATIKYEPDDCYWDEDRPTLDEWCRKPHNKEDTCIFFTQRQLEEMHIRPNREGRFLHVPYSNQRDIRQYHSKRGMNKHDADQMARNWIRLQLEEAACPDAEPECVVTVKIKVCGEVKGMDSLGGVSARDERDIIDAVLEHMMVTNALADARASITAELVHGPRQLEGIETALRNG